MTHPTNKTVAPVAYGFLAGFATSNASCPLVDFMLFKVEFKNGTEFTPAQYGSIITFTNATVTVGIQDYAGVNPEDFNELKVYVKAKTNFMVSEPFHVLTLSVNRGFNYLAAPIPPYFSLPLEPINLEYEYFTDQEFDIVEYQLPEIKDVSGGTNL